MPARKAKGGLPVEDYREARLLGDGGAGGHLFAQLFVRRPAARGPTGDSRRRFRWPSRRSPTPLVDGLACCGDASGGSRVSRRSAEKEHQEACQDGDEHQDAYRPSSSRQWSRAAGAPRGAGPISSSAASWDGHSGQTPCSSRFRSWGRRVGRSPAPSGCHTRSCARTRSAGHFRRRFQKPRRCSR